MRVPKRVQYGIIIMVSIGMYSDDVTNVSLLDISSKNHLSMKFLENIATNLKVNNLIVSKRGCKNGGYRLTKDPKDITLTEIIRALDDSLLGEKPRFCDDQHDIANTVDRMFWGRINQSTLEITDSITLDSIIEYSKAY